MQKIILFDGECNFCNQSVQFIIKRDTSGHFSFAHLQSDIGLKLIEQYNIPQDTHSLLLIHNGKWSSKSSAAFYICRYLNGFWKLFHPLLIIPKPIRDFFYNIIAKNRYKLSSRNKTSCLLPTPEMKKRFLK